MPLSDAVERILNERRQVLQDRADAIVGMGLDTEWMDAALDEIQVLVELQRVLLLDALRAELRRYQ